MIGENRLKFKTAEKLPIILEEPMEYTPILIIKENRRMPTCNRLELQTLGSQPIMPKNLPDHCSEPTASEGMASSFSNLNYTVKKIVGYFATFARDFMHTPTKGRKENLKCHRCTQSYLQVLQLDILKAGE